VVAAISAAGLRHEFEGGRVTALADRLKASAARISAALGGRVSELPQTRAG
jgi:DNA-binding IclR family transcriptional regulator